ncbi:MAG: efflux RND transporter periplasmic adaptor subunit [Magnetococcus sp. YQC-5]
MQPFLLFFLLMLLASPPMARAAEPIQVTIRPLAQLLIHPRQEAPAETRSLNDGLITAQVTGTIVEIPTQVGDRVKAGDILVRLDPWAYRLAQQRSTAELAAMRAQLVLAQKQAGRALQLQQQKQASDELLEQRQTEVKHLTAQINGLEAALEESRIHIQKCLIQAPFAGVIVQRLARIGVTATSGTPLIQLVDTDALELSAPIATGQVESLTRATAWEFLHEGHRYPLRLRTVTPYVDPVARTQEARLLFQETKPVPGSTGRLIWHDPRPHLPAWPLVQRDKTLGIFLAQGDKAEFYPLPHAIEGHPALVEPDLQGDLILSGREGLTQGAVIRTIQTSDTDVTKP